MKLKFIMICILIKLNFRKTEHKAQKDYLSRCGNETAVDIQTAMDLLSVIKQAVS